MDSQEKFLFQTSFDADALTRAAEAEAAAESAEEEPPAPTFSEDEMAAAKQTAFAEGKAAGQAEAEGGIARRTEEHIAALVAKLDSLSEALSAQLAEKHSETLLAAMTVVRKIFPRLNREGRLDEIQAVVEDCVERLRDEPRMVVRAADQELDSLKAHVDTCIERSGFSGKIVFLADDRLSPGDVRVEWADGGAERDQAALWREIDAIIERLLKPEAGETGQVPAPQAAASEKNDTSKPTPSADIEPLRRAQTA